MKRILLLAVMLSVLGIQLHVASGQLLEPSKIGTEISRGGMTVTLLDNTDTCEVDCYSVYRVCGASVSKSQVSLDFKNEKMGAASIRNQQLTVTSSKGCYEVKVEAQKNAWENVDNIPTIRGYEFPEFAWWNTSCNRKQLSICGYSGDLQDGIEWDYNTNGNGISADGYDFRVIYDDGTATELDRYNITYFNENATTILFPLQATISSGTCDNSSYFLYYNCVPSTAPASNRSNIYDHHEYFDYSAGDSVGSLWTEESGDDWDADGNGNVYIASYDGKATLTALESAVGYSDNYIAYGRFRTNSVPNGWIGVSMDGDDNGDSEGAIGTGFCLDISVGKANFMDDTYCGAAFSQGSYSFSANTYYYYEFRKAGTSYEIRIWGMDEERPAAATHSTTHTAVASGDYVKMIGDTTSDTLWNESGFMRITSPTITPGAEEEHVSNYDPVATLISPNSGTTHTNYTIEFNCTGSDVEDLDNVTIYFEGAGYSWHANETASLSGTWDSHIFSLTFPEISQDEVITWNCLVTDNDSATDWADSNYTLTLDFLDTSETYETTAQETSVQDINITVSVYSAAVTDVDAYLFYDGVNESYDVKSSVGGNYSFGAQVIPGLVENNATNKTFNWVYVVHYSNGSSQDLNSTDNNQLITWSYYPTSAVSVPPAVTQGENITITVSTTQDLALATVNVSIWLDDEESQDTTKSGTDYFKEFSTAGINTTVYFNGSMNVSYGGIFYIRNTTSYSLAVAEIILTNCSAASESQTVALGFWIYDEDDDSDLTGNLDVSFDVWSDPSNIVTYSFEFTGDNNYSVCIYPTTATYTIDMIAQFDATGYDPRNYYLDDASISNSSQTIDLYLGSNSSQDLIAMQVLNSLSLPEEDVYINIAEYDIGTGAYTTVAIVKTDYDGKAYSYLTKNTKWYRFTLTQDGTVLEQYDPTIITEDSLTFRLTQGELGEYFGYYDNVAWNCTWPSNTTTCTVTDTTGLMVSAELFVKQWTALGYIDTCSVSDTGASVTLVCPMGSLTGKIFYYSLKAEFASTEDTLEAGFKDYRTGTPTYGDLGVMVALMLLIVMSFLGAYRWEISMVLAATSIALSWMAGLIFITASSVMAIFIVMAIAIYKTRST